MQATTYRTADSPTLDEVREQLAAWIAAHDLPAPARSDVLVGTAISPYIMVKVATLDDLRAWAKVLGARLEPVAVLDDETDVLSAWVRTIDRDTPLQGVAFPLTSVTWWPR